MTVKYKYEYDPDASLPENHIIGERHTLYPVPIDNFNFFIPKASPFFGKDAVVRHVGSNTVLTEGVHYALAYMFRQFTDVLLQPLYGGILILDPTFVGEFEIDYRTIGSKFVLDEEKLLKLLTDPLIDPRTVYWEDINVTPKDYLPFPYLGDTLDMVGQKELVEKLEEIRIAITGEKTANHVHETAQINGLDEIISAAVEVRGAAKFDKAGHVFVDGSDTHIAFTIPQFPINTVIYTKLFYISESKEGVIEVLGKVHADTDIYPDIDWVSLSATHNGGFDELEVSGSYDSNNVPTLYLKSDELIGCRIFAMVSVSNTALPENYNDGWGLYSTSNPRGTERSVPYELQSILDIIENLGTGTGDEIGAIRDELDRLNLKDDEHDLSLAALVQKDTELDSAILALEQTTSSNEAAIVELQNKDISLDLDIANLSGRNDAQDAAILSLQQSEGEQDTKLLEHGNELTDINEQIADIQSTLSDVDRLVSGAFEYFDIGDGGEMDHRLRYEIKAGTTIKMPPDDGNLLEGVIKIITNLDREVSDNPAVVDGNGMTIEGESTFLFNVDTAQIELRKTGTDWRLVSLTSFSF